MNSQFYNTVHSINAKDYTEEQLNVLATGSVDLENKFQGNWEVKQLRLHKVSHIFWNNVINQYTLGNFIELENGNEVWDGPIHRFSNK